MFNECGKKIQKIVKILFIIGMILSILWLLISFSAGDIEGISASIYLLVTCLISVFPFYGLGILVENAEENIRERKERDYNERKIIKS
ncbi:MAG TPA: hypothetical protein DC000_00685 [Clostridiales bacterium]|nr:hypothetical protein [Clostridiales bacterium]